MKSRYSIVIILSLSFLFLLGIASFGHAAGETSYYQPPNRSPITHTINISTYLPFVIKADPFLYADDFSDPSSGWPVDDNGDVKRSYQAGEYEILTREINYWAGSVPPLADITNYSAVADMRIPNGNTGFYGLIFDRVDWNHFYIFVVSPTSQVYAVLRHDPSWVMLTPFAPSAAINTGSTTNRLRVDRMGGQITVYVNDQPLTSLVDGTYTSVLNEVGLFSQSDTNVPVEMRFDNFTISRLATTDTQRALYFAMNPAVLSSEGQGFFGLEP